MYVLICIFCFSVNSEAASIDIRAKLYSLCGRGSHGSVVVVVPLQRDRCSQIAVIHVPFNS
jgi:hypothetical protein